jgi:hypothetical protein
MKAAAGGPVLASVHGASRPLAVVSEAGVRRFDATVVKLSFSLPVFFRDQLGKGERMTPAELAAGAEAAPVALAVTLGALTLAVDTWGNSTLEAAAASDAQRAFLLPLPVESGRDARIAALAQT